MSAFKVLLVEDDSDLREAIAVTLRMSGVNFLAFETAEEALTKLDPEMDQLLVTDFRLPGMNGLQLLEKARQKNTQLPVVVMTAYADTQLAVQALKSGARDFLIKPFLPQQLIEVVARHRPQPLSAKSAESVEIIAADAATLALISRCKRVAQTDATVLLTGESGAGKDVFARFIHQRSPRKQRPYLALNCAAIPESLLESTLFGYEKGAFTGATRAQPGKFEQAHRGTLFLDEIGEMPLNLQAKLLRVLQDQVVERLGSTRTANCDVRIIAATNKNLSHLVKAGRFREDLYFRLAVFPIRIPSLRERRADIQPLAEYFLRKYSRPMSRQGMSLSLSGQHALLQHHWPGNVRELENAIQRALLLCETQSIEPSDLELQSNEGDPALKDNLGTEIAHNVDVIPPLVPQDIESIERNHILKTLKQLGGSRKDAIQILGLSERALRYKLKAYKEAGFDVD